MARRISSHRPALTHLQARRQGSELNRMEALKREVDRHEEMLVKTIEEASEVRHKRGERIMDRIESEANLNHYLSLLHV